MTLPHKLFATVLAFKFYQFMNAVDWAHMACQYATVFMDNGRSVLTNFEAIKFQSSKACVEVTSSDTRKVSCAHVLSCAGLYGDRVASPLLLAVVPFRGEYLLLTLEKAMLIKGNIYPVPDPRFPFLGVHFTPRMNGEVWLGPNAVLAMAREGYS